jgi:hypothetical protein
MIIVERGETLNTFLSLSHAMTKKTFMVNGMK